jgi:hypothetical protein
VRLRHLASHLHSLGPRATYEFLKEVTGGADPMERLERYSRLTPEMLHALGGYGWKKR